MKKTLSLILAIALIVTCSNTVYAGSRSSKKIRLSKSSVTMKVSQSKKLYLSKNGRKIISGVKWKSSNKKVVTVSGGKLKAKKTGSATVTAKYKGKKYKCKVKVKKASSKKPYIPKAYDLKIPEASYEAAREMEQFFINREAFNLWIKGDKKNGDAQLAVLADHFKTFNDEGATFETGTGYTKQYEGYQIYHFNKHRINAYWKAIEFTDKLFTMFKDADRVGGLMCDEKRSDQREQVTDCSNLQYYKAVYECCRNSGSTEDLAGYMKSQIREYRTDALAYKELVSKYYEASDLEREEPEMQDTVQLAHEKMEALRARARNNFFVCIPKARNFYARDYESMEEEMDDAQSFMGSICKRVKPDYEKAAVYGRALSAEHFGELSDAMKIWVIGVSGYFWSSEDGRDDTYVYNTERMKWENKGRERFFRMMYSYDYPLGGMQADTTLQSMIDNKMKGLCARYSGAEETLFKHLGIETYCSGYKEHAFTVVKVRNSEGKDLWIPFDYGIGPSVYKNNFEGYMETIQGAPKSRNYEYSDFN